MEEFGNDRYKFFFVYLAESVCEASWSQTFVCREFLNYRLYFTWSDRSVQIICLFLIQFWWVYVSRKRFVIFLTQMDSYYKQYWPSLKIQWLGPCAFTVGELKSHRLSTARKPKKTRSYCIAQRTMFNTL